MSAALRWLAPLRAAVPDLAEPDWVLLSALDAHLDRLTGGAPTAEAGSAARSAWLLSVRRELATAGYATLTLPTPHGAGRPAVQQTLAQFVCGFHDLDLRDATGPGHGALLTAVAEPTRSRWLNRLAAGQMIGVAATERHGGSRIHDITTSAIRISDRRWEISGEKVWVSRLTEAAGIVVFFRDPAGQISAAIVDADAPGLDREPITPAGLTGWTWGVLRLHQVPVDPHTDLIGHGGAGLAIFRDHFTRFRPLVTAAALGTAAAVHHAIAAVLAARTRLGILPRVRDNALIALGQTHATLTAALLATLATTRLAHAGHADAHLWAAAGKAHGVDAAHRAVNDLAPLIGAAGFQHDSVFTKARNDLAALLYADGIHDSLYRSAGKTILAIIDGHIMSAAA